MLPGGSACNTARQLHALAAACGGSTHFFGTTGKDHLGSVAINHMEAQDFSTQHIKRLDVPSSACIVLSGPQDRGFVSCYSSIYALNVGQLDKEALKTYTHIHIGGYLGVKGLHTSEFTQLLKECKDRGATLSLGTNSACDDNWLGNDKHLANLLPLLDLLLVNERELGEIEKVLGSSISNKFPHITVVQTRGKDGARVNFNGASLDVPTEVVEKPVDLTGAGDAFAAGFIFRWASKSSTSGQPDRDLYDSGIWGNSCSNCTVKKNGACSVPTTYEEVVEAYQKLSAKAAEEKS
eukprot:TRINITY_DN9088_c1_g1_i9.p1 TRINITY_DN9088_c1_g1~~TRINITY_DN9088_c1_g1_i9.p1  ORF type:complete len:294 (+),score=45.80 TRINITY_DN9088_c1_g1_i9:297-1178(+)